MSTPLARFGSLLLLTAGIGPVLAGCSENHTLYDSRTPSAVLDGDGGTAGGSGSDLSDSGVLADSGPVDGKPGGGPGPVCAAVGEPCAAAADCCSLGCDGERCVEALCRSEGQPCGGDAECCANRCVESVCEVAGACLPVGEDCATGGSAACCSLNCAPAADGKMRCAGLGACRGEGEVCTEPADCCNYLCDKGFCRVDPNCDISGLVCEQDSACCSGVCRDDGTGFKTCRTLGGCRPSGELCWSDTSCCGGEAIGAGACIAVIGSIGTCAAPAGCASAGELCGPGYPACCPCATPEESAGCPNPDGDRFCRQTTEGVSRCFSERCVLGGGACTTGRQCCSGSCVEKVCGDGFACLGDGEPCALPDQCCCGRCEAGDDDAFACCPD